MVKGEREERGVVQARGAGKACLAAVQHVLGIKEDAEAYAVIVPVGELLAYALARLADAGEQYGGV